MAALFSVLGVTGLLLLPGLGLAALLDPRGEPITRAGLAAALGLAFAVIRAVVWHQLGLLTHLGWLWPIEGALALAGVSAWAWRGRPRAAATPVGLAVAAATILGAALRLAIVRGQAGPSPAYDAAAHCTLARALAENPGRATWAPFMDAAPHYPWGAHALLVEVSALSGVPIHGAFSVLLTGGLGAAGIVVIAGLARALWRRDDPAVGAAWIYALASGALGLLYGRWGGLPAELALTLGCGVALALTRGRRGTVAVGVLTLGLLLTHHLSAAIVAAALLPPVLGLAWVAPRAHAPWLRSLALAGGAAALLAAPMWWVVLSVDLARDTAAFAVPRHMDLLTLGAESVGAYVLLFAALPLASGALPPARSRVALLASIVGLVCAFVLLFSVAKLATGVLGAPRAMLVPTRWIAACTYPLTILAGGGAAWLWSRCTLRLLRAGGLAAMVSLALYASWRVSVVQLDPALWEFQARVASLAAPGDVALALHDQARWTGYRTGLENNAVPAPPGSDPLTPRARALAAMPARLLRGEDRGPLAIRGRVWVVADLRVRPLPRRDDLVLVEQQGPLLLLRWEETP